jgi:signal-transduction protein with cAMP-binding, CBS, and nucleotidyltransferase domain
VSCRINKLAQQPDAALPSDADIQRAAEFMARHDLGSVIVTEDNRAVGVFTEKDLIKRVVGAGRDPQAVTLGEVCTRNLISIDADESCETAIKSMRANRCRRLLLYRGETFLGVVTLQAVAQELADHRSRKNVMINVVGGATVLAALALIALWLYQLPEMARLAMQVMK